VTTAQSRQRASKVGGRVECRTSLKHEVWDNSKLDHVELCDNIVLPNLFSFTNDPSLDSSHLYFASFTKSISTGELSHFLLSQSARVELASTPKVVDTWGGQTELRPEYNDQPGTSRGFIRSFDDLTNTYKSLYRSTT